MSIVTLIVALVLIGLCFWVIKTLSGTFGIPAPIVTVIQVVLVVLIVLWLLQGLGLMNAGPVIRLR